MLESISTSQAFQLSTLDKAVQNLTESSVNNIAQSTILSSSNLGNKEFFDLSFKALGEWSTSSKILLTLGIICSVAFIIFKKISWKNNPFPKFSPSFPKFNFDSHNRVSTYPIATTSSNNSNSSLSLKTKSNISSQISSLLKIPQSNTETSEAILVKAVASILLEDNLNKPSNKDNLFLGNDLSKHAQNDLSFNEFSLLERILLGSISLGDEEWQNISLVINTTKVHSYLIRFNSRAKVIISSINESDKKISLVK